MHTHQVNMSSLAGEWVEGVKVKGQAEGHGVMMFYDGIRCEWRGKRWGNKGEECVRKCWEERWWLIPRSMDQVPNSSSCWGMVLTTGWSASKTWLKNSASSSAAWADLWWLCTYYRDTWGFFPDQKPIITCGCNPWRWQGMMGPPWGLL